MEAQIDRIAIAGLENQYSIPRSVLHERMNALGIKRTKIGSRSYIDSESLTLLNELDDHMKSKQPMALFLERVKKQSGGQSVSNLALVEKEEDQKQIYILINAIAYLMSLKQPSLWNDYEQLELVGSKQWAIATSRLLPLLGRKSMPKLDDQNRFKYMGFVFWKVGKIGNQYAFKITKE